MTWPGATVIGRRRRRSPPPRRPAATGPGSAMPGMSELGSAAASTDRAAGPPRQGTGHEQRPGEDRRRDTAPGSRRLRCGSLPSGYPLNEERPGRQNRPGLSLAWSPEDPGSSSLMVVLQSSVPGAPATRRHHRPRRHGRTSRLPSPGGCSSTPRRTRWRRERSPWLKATSRYRSWSRPRCRTSRLRPRRRSRSGT